MIDGISATAPAPKAEFLIGDILRRSHSIVQRKALSFALLFGIASLPELLEPLFGGLLVSTILSLLLASVCYSAAILIACEDLHGRPLGAQDAVVRVSPSVTNVIAMIVLLIIGSIIGLVLLLVPGFIFLAVTLIAWPICVVERLGPVNCIRRSAELTKGYRWPALGLLAALLVPNLVVALLLERTGADTTLIGAVANFVWQAIWSSYMITAETVAYQDLHALKSDDLVGNAAPTA